VRKPNKREIKPSPRAAFLLKEGKTMATPASEPATGTATTNVFCKHPLGLVLRVGEFVDRSEGSAIHARTVKEWQQTASFTVTGPARRIGEDAKAPVIGGYAVTYGVPKDLWDKWFADHKEDAMVKNGVIFARDKLELGNGQATEQKEIRTGLEPLSQGADPRARGSDRVEKMTSAAA
jgi:hypothetical protein